MTRLISQQIADIPDTLADYDRLLREQTGCSLVEIAIRAARPGHTVNQSDFSAVQVAVVPVTAGQGLITGFSGAVAAIIAYLGFPVRTTFHTDVAGFAEALESCAKIIFLADDNKFIAYNIATGTYTDNGEATGLAFATALNAAAVQSAGDSPGAEAGGLRGRKTAVLGLGPVGRAAVELLDSLGAQPVVYDPDPVRVGALLAKYAADGMSVEAVSSVEAALASTDYVFDASPAPGIIPAALITGKTIVAGPGIPHGLTAEARRKLGPRRFIHDPLQLGVAVMTVKSLYPV